jgi:hypothetical protein
VGQEPKKYGKSKTAASANDRQRKWIQQRTEKVRSHSSSNNKFSKIVAASVVNIASDVVTLKWMQKERIRFIEE